MVIPMKTLTLVISLLAVLTGCGGGIDDSTRQRAVAAVAEGALLIDVRSAEEVAGGTIDGAINIPHGEIVEGMNKLGVSKDQAVVLYCRSGNRSGMATEALEKAGYSNLINAGGYRDLKAVFSASASK